MAFVFAGFVYVAATGVCALVAAAPQATCDSNSAIAIASASAAVLHARRCCRERPHRHCCRLPRLCYGCRRCCFSCTPPLLPPSLMPTPLPLPPPPLLPPLPSPRSVLLPSHPPLLPLPLPLSPQSPPPQLPLLPPLPSHPLCPPLLLLPPPLSLHPRSSLLPSLFLRFVPESRSEPPSLESSCTLSPLTAWFVTVSGSIAFPLLLSALRSFPTGLRSSFLICPVVVGLTFQSCPKAHVARRSCGCGFSEASISGRLWSWPRFALCGRPGLG